MTYRDVSIISVNGKTPTIDPSAFIAPGCTIVGDVTINGMTSGFVPSVSSSRAATVRRLTLTRYGR